MRRVTAAAAFAAAALCARAAGGACAPGVPGRAVQPRPARRQCAADAGRTVRAAGLRAGGARRRTVQAEPGRTACGSGRRGLGRGGAMAACAGVPHGARRAVRAQERSASVLRVRADGQRGVPEVRGATVQGRPAAGVPGGLVHGREVGDDSEGDGTGGGRRVFDREGVAGGGGGLLGIGGGSG